RWFRDYLYVPLGGNRGPRWRTYLNLSVVFLFCGLWHGASWTFVLWGAFHGALLIVERAGWGRVLARLPGGGQHLPSARWGGVGWVRLRGATVPAAGVYFRALAGFGARSDLVQLLSTLAPEVVLALTVGVIGSTPVLQQLRRRRARVGLELGSAGAGWLRDAAALGLLFLSVLQVASGAHNPFLHFRFGCARRSPSPRKERSLRARVTAGWPWPSSFSSRCRRCSASGAARRGNGHGPASRR